MTRVTTTPRRDQAAVIGAGITGRRVPLALTASDGASSAARVVRGPWAMNTPTDRAGQGTGVPLSSHIATRYLEAVTAQLPHDTGLFLRFARTIHIFDTSGALLAPRTVPI
jgi:hypothetical protein